MQFYFEGMREETLGGQAELVVGLEPLRAQCRNCGRKFTFAEPEWMCPGCGGWLSYENGNELDLVSVEVENG
jgi:Zn finger protein HypA/HybF involved in hydrogenase expression